MCGEIAQGIEYLAGKTLVHRHFSMKLHMTIGTPITIKIINFFLQYQCRVDGNLNMKVVDFGLNRDIYETDCY